MGNELLVQKSLRDISYNFILRWLASTRVANGAEVSAAVLIKFSQVSQKLQIE